MANPTPTVNLEEYYIVKNVSTVLQLQNYNTTITKNGTIINVNEVGEFQFQTPAISTPDGVNIIQSNTGNGVWLRTGLPILFAAQLGDNYKITTSSLADELSNLTDVTITNPENGQAITYLNGIWINTTGTPGPTDLSLEQLTDVEITNKQNGQFLSYDSLLGKWINATYTPESVSLEQLTDVNVTNIQNGQSLVYNAPTQKWINATISPGPTNLSLEQLTDVNITNIQNAQFLSYNSLSGKWINTTYTPGSISLEQLTDVNITNIQNAQYLQYNSIAQKWINASGSPTPSLTPPVLITTSSIIDAPTVTIQSTNASNNTDNLVLNYAGTTTNLDITNTGTVLTGTAHSNCIRSNSGNISYLQTDATIGGASSCASFGVVTMNNENTSLGIVAQRFRNRSMTLGAGPSGTKNYGTNYTNGQWISVDSTDCIATLETLTQPFGVGYQAFVTSGETGLVNGKIYSFQNIPSTSGTGFTVDVTTNGNGVITSISGLNRGTGYKIDDLVTINTPGTTNFAIIQITNVNSSGEVQGSELIDGGGFEYGDGTNVPTIGYSGAGSLGYGQYVQGINYFLIIYGFGSNFLNYQKLQVNGGDNNLILYITNPLPAGTPSNIGYPVNSIIELSVATEGSGYTNGTYPCTQIPCTNGFGATMDIYTMQGVITNIDINDIGLSYAVCDILTVATLVGSGAIIVVTAVTSNGGIDNYILMNGGHQYISTQAVPVVGYPEYGQGGTGATITLNEQVTSSSTSFGIGIDSNNSQSQKGNRNIWINDDGTVSVGGAVYSTSYISSTINDSYPAYNNVFYNDGYGNEIKQTISWQDNLSLAQTFVTRALLLFVPSSNYPYPDKPTNADVILSGWIECHFSQPGIGTGQTIGWSLWAYTTTNGNTQITEVSSQMPFSSQKPFQIIVSENAQTRLAQLELQFKYSSTEATATIKCYTSTSFSNWCSQILTINNY